MDANERCYIHEDTSPILLTPSQWILLVQADAERPYKTKSAQETMDAWEMDEMGLTIIVLTTDGVLVQLRKKGRELLNSAGPNEVFDVLQELANEAW